jgi:hypothetical protein
MFKDSSLSKKQESLHGFSRRVVVSMIIFAVVIFGGAWLLSDPNAKSADVISLTSPVNGQKIWLKNQAGVRFEWSGVASEDAFLEVSRDRNFQDLVFHQTAPKSPFVTDKLPGEGDYFYRIVQSPSNHEQATLEPIGFTLVTLAPPQLIYPFTPMSISETKPLRFYWQGKHGVSHYRFQIAFESNFENLLSDLLLDETQTIPQQIPAGQFFWRVRGEDDPTSATNWSEVRALRSEVVVDITARKNVINIAPHPTKAPSAASRGLTPPKMTRTSQKIRLQYRGGKSRRTPASIQEALLTPPHLSWQVSKGATAYEVQISRKMDFSEIEWTKSVSKPGIKWVLAKPGIFFWRVQASDKTGTKSSFSSPGRLELSLPAPKMKKLFSHLVKIKTQAQREARSPVAITWTEVPAASGYRVLVSKNKKFNSNLLDLKVERNLASLDIDNVGHYFVKVAALGTAGEPVSDFSEPASIEYEMKDLIPASASIPAPRLKLPPNGVSIVSLNGSQDPISFRWEDTGVNSYRLEISADEGFQKILYSTLAKENHITINRPMPRGMLYWRLRSEKGSIKSDWSSTFTFEFAK